MEEETEEEGGRGERGRGIINSIIVTTTVTMMRTNTITRGIVECCWCGHNVVTMMMDGGGG